MSKLLSLLLASLFVTFAVASDEWFPQHSLLRRRSDHSCHIHQDRLYLIGGCASDQVYEDNYSACDKYSNHLESFQFYSNKWVSLASLPTPRNRHVSSLINGKIYVFGGVILVNDQETVTTDVDIYDIATNKWTTMAGKFTEARTDMASFTHGSKIYLAGGWSTPAYNSTGATHVFDTATNKFKFDIAEMVNGRGDHCVQVVNGKAYAVGGYTQEDFCAPIERVEEFNFDTERWIAKTNSDRYGRGDAACAVVNNMLVQFGGEEKDVNCMSDPQSSVIGYDPIENTWAPMPNYTLPIGTMRFCAAVNDTIYITGGQGPLEIKGGRESHSLLANFYVYGSAASFTPNIVLLMASMLALLWKLF